ncbi:unnamed protein product [Caenorhabditis angaria]|uniref:Uncharacterized protein n=1 Tax=Caenorhabditis angaria TaxID=860376 RepID=A0A9P1IMA2_9PELO|nr:unnamed protein product [Caenorhabditis angaria]
MEFFDIPQEYRDCSANNNEEILNLERKNGNHNQNQIQNQILDDLMEIIHEDEKRSEETLCADPDDEYLKKTNWQLNQPILDCSDESDMNQSNFENSQNFNNNFFGTELESPIYVPSLISPNSEFSEELPEEFLNQYLQNTSNNEVLDTGNAWNSNVLQENGKVLYILQPKTEFHQAENNLNNYFENLELTSPTSTISSDIPYFPISDFDTIKSEFSQKMLERPKRNRAKKSGNGKVESR